MKMRLFFACILSALYLPVFSQTCDDGCNLINNGNFTILTTAINSNVLCPFNVDAVTCWKASHGSPHLPQIQTTGCSPNPDPCYEDFVYMYSGNNEEGEGIYQFQDFDNGSHYLLLYDYELYSGSANTLPDFYVKLINTNNLSTTCTDHSFPSASSILDETTVDHLTNITNTSFQTRCTFFTADNDYEALWLYPYSNGTYPNIPRSAIVHVKNIQVYKIGGQTSYTLPCGGGSVTLNSGACNIPGATYSWSPGTGLSSTSVLSPTVTLTNTTSAPVTYTYTLSITIGGCTSTQTYQVVVPPDLTTPVISGPITACVGESVPYSASATNFDLFQWSCPNTSITANTDGTAATIVFHQAGTHTVSVTNYDPSGNCSVTQTYTVTVFPKPPVPVITGSTSGCSDDFTYTVSNFSGTAAHYSVSVTGGTLLSPVNASGQFVVQWSGTGGTISVTHTDHNGCQNTGTYTVFGCCTSVAAWVTVWPGNNDQSSQLITLNGNANVLWRDIYINTALYIDQDITFTGCNLYLGPEAKIEVLTGKNVVFDGCILTHCTSLWDGIHVSDATSMVTVHNSSVYNARNAVLSTNGGNFIVRGSTFTDNHIGIFAKDYLYPNSHQGEVYGNTFTASASPLFPPSFGFTGVKLENMASIHIGSPTQAVNTFTHLDYGVDTRYANYKLYHNEFSYIEPVAKVNGGVAVQSSFVTAPILVGPVIPNPYPNIHIGDIGTNYGNKFIHCSNAIALFAGGTANIKNNDLDYIDQYGIVTYLHGNGNQINIYNNVMGDVRYGIFSAEQSLSNSALYFINHNIISRTELGIEAYGVYGPKMQWNCVSTIDATSLPDQTAKGIRHVSCYKPLSRDNTLHADNNTVGIGVQTENSKLFHTRCNEVMTSVGIKTLNDCSTSKIECNDLSVNQYGYYQHGGPIGPQGSTTTALDNVIHTVPFKIVNENVPGTLSPFYVRNTSPYLILQSEAVSFTTGFFPITMNAITPSHSVHCPCNTPDITSCARLPQGVVDTADFTYEGWVGDALDLLAWIENDTLGKSDTLVENEKEALYKMLLGKASIANTELQDFKDDFSVTTLGKLHQADHLLSEVFSTSTAAITAGNAANTLLTGITPVTAAEENWYTLLQIMITAAGRGDNLAFTPEEMEDIQTLAELCPFGNGDAVYKARLLLFILTRQRVVHACELPAPDPKKAVPQQEGIQQPENLLIYPNPNAGNFMVVVPLMEGETANAIIYDLAGREVHRFTTVQSLNNVTLPHPGSYIVRVSIQGQQPRTLTQRMIVIE